MKLNLTNLKRVIRFANWSALTAPTMEYRVTLCDGELTVTEWLANSNSYREGEQYLFTACYWPRLEGTTAPIEQHAFIEQIPGIAHDVCRDLRRLGIELE